MNESVKYIGVNGETGNVECRGVDADYLQLACAHLGEDAVLVYFEEYVKRLETGYYRVGPLLDEELVHGSADAILLYPEITTAHIPRTNFDQLSSGAARTVTRGVEVIASATYCP